MPLIWRHGSTLPWPRGLLLLRASPLIRRPRPQPSRWGGRAAAVDRNLSTIRCTRGKQR
ncbi:hypothetical protein ACFYNL_30860 [Streptomyces sp. NPDC007808]|uniref:hypothetical protein n=1 Tax=Streptomyces sp. NPDC007808 TaxID=3364779 RepID=UPI0036A23AEB